VFALVAGIWSIALGVVKFLVYYPTWLLLGLLSPSLRQRWAKWWYDRSIVTKVENHLRAHWRRQHIYPTEGLWLVYRMNDRVAPIISLSMVVGGLLLISYPGTMVVIELATALIGGWYLSWCTWLATLYGVHTLDLEIMLRVSLWLTEKLSWILARRAGQDMLREALKRVREGREDR
jgi:hypothetical protein